MARLATFVSGLASVLVCTLPASGQISGPGANQPNQNPGSRQNPRTNAPSPYVFGSINRQPWFRDQSVRTHLRLTEEQYNRLNNLYTTNFARYDQGVAGMGALDDMRRREQFDTLSATFNRDFRTGIQDVLQPDQRSRFDQMWLQYQGAGAFADPALQAKFNLNAQQIAELNRLNWEWRTDFGKLQQRFPNDRNGFNQAFAEARRARWDRINSILNADQRRMWVDLTGENWDFQVDFDPAPRQ